MKIKVSEATGSVLPQFVVYMEGEEERILVRLALACARKEGKQFKLFGEVCTAGVGVTSFNFGWEDNSGSLRLSTEEEHHIEESSNSTQD